MGEGQTLLNGLDLLDLFLLGAEGLLLHRNSVFGGGVLEDVQLALANVVDLVDDLVVLFERGLFGEIC